ncbi:uncharacterized protein C22orf15 isoform X2 [Cyprinodon tularosa]|uniref:uncharacterized protein C22orf15 isoform X2 n=1 Tax=Cyprinodon tularosa TaxID=77115 RepID=UPI0018E21502|nr:uncharacterized protein C22orf15 isoform X2 [Cyprinodon tularosa]
MFVTVLFGDDRMEILNLNCKLVHFIHHLKERCGLDSSDCVELMDSTGRVMNLEPMQHSMAQASSVLAERQCYILLRVCQENEESGGCKHVSLLNNAKSHPELTGLMKRLSNPSKVSERKNKRGRTQRSRKTCNTDNNKYP